jgi:hypothetical protein
VKNECEKGRGERRAIALEVGVEVITLSVLKG